jgi:hypothetical protein
MDDVITLYVDETTSRPVYIYPDLTGVTDAMRLQSDARSAVLLNRESVDRIIELAKEKGWA